MSEPLAPSPVADLHTTTEREVRTAAHAYEAALVSGDTAAAAGWFATVEPVSRFGPEGAQLGADAIGALRASTAPVGVPRWLYEEVRVLAPGSAIHLALLDRGGRTVQRTQVWQRSEAGWRISHAHVSSVVPPS